MTQGDWSPPSEDSGGAPQYGALPGYGGPPGYGSAQMYGPGYVVRRDVMPGTVQAARVLMFVQAGLSTAGLLLLLLVGVVVGLVTGSSSSGDAHRIGGAVLVVLGIIFVIGAAVTVLLFVCAAKLSSRRPGIRIAATIVEGILSGLGTVSLLGNIVVHQYASVSTSLAWASIAVTVCVLLLTTSGRDYFRS